MALHILVIEHDGQVGPMLAEMLRVSGFNVTSAETGFAMREILTDKATLKLDAVVLDCSMPGEPSAQLALMPSACASRWL